MFIIDASFHSAFSARFIDANKSKEDFWESEKFAFSFSHWLLVLQLQHKNSRWVWFMAESSLIKNRQWAREEKGENTIFYVLGLLKLHFPRSFCFMYKKIYKIVYEFIKKEEFLCPVRYNIHSRFHTCMME